MSDDASRRDETGKPPRPNFSGNDLERTPFEVGRRLAGVQPVRTFIKLGILSLIVGLFISFLGLDPVEFWRGAWNMISGLVSMLGDTAIEIIRNLATYLIFGAAIVIPVWIAYRLLNAPRR